MTAPTPTRRVRTRPAPPAAEPIPPAPPHSPDDAEPHIACDESDEQSEHDAERPVAAADYARSRDNPAYAVGYKRPPVQHQFKKGQRANPKGRPKDSKNIGTLAREAFSAKVEVRQGGRSRKMSKAEVGFAKLANRFAETGDPKFFQAVMKLLEPTFEYNMVVDAQPLASDQEPLAPSNKDILAWYLARNSAGSAPDSEGSSSGSNENGTTS